MLSPYLFAACYLNDLIERLREADLGCYVYSIYVGVVAYADDLCLLAPNAAVLQEMVIMCEEYGSEHNLLFSTDPVPARSKTKCLVFTGNNRAVTLRPIMLNNKPLPWVDRVDHLGHVLQQNMSMEADSVRAKCSFRARASDIRDNLYFATPSQKMQAIQLNVCDGYGSMLWKLDSEYAASYFKQWNIQARLSWSIPRTTHVYLVENYFCSTFTSLKRQIFSRYSNFLRKLTDSPSYEVNVLSTIFLRDARSITCQNFSFLSELIDVNIIDTTLVEFKSLVQNEEAPAND